MSKKAFVIICSLVIIVGFIFSCYLITTVNPEPIVTDKPIGRERDFVFDFENMHDQNHFGDLQYGLGKAPPSSETPVPLPYLFRKNNPNLMNTQKYSNHKTVYPNQVSQDLHLHATRTSPMLPSESKAILQYTCQHFSTQFQVTKLPKNNTETIQINKTDQISHSVKGRRRSIDSLQKRFGGISGSILLKIVDEHGKSTIEIKVNTKDTNTFRNKKSSIDNNSALSDDDTPHEFLVSLDELPDRTEIRILPNSSLVVRDVSEEFDSKLDIRTENSSQNAQINEQNSKHTSKYVNVKGHNDTIAVISRPGSNEPTAAMTVAVGNTNHVIQRTTQSVKQLMKTTSTGDLALKVLFDNLTRSFSR